MLCCPTEICHLKTLRRVRQQDIIALQRQKLISSCSNLVATFFILMGTVNRKVLAEEILQAKWMQMQAHSVAPQVLVLASPKQLRELS